MSALSKAIYAYFISDLSKSFYIDIGGKLRHKKAKQEDTFPYCVFFFPTEDNDPDFTDDHADFEVQFNIFSENNSSGEADQLLESLREMFDNANFSVVGWNLLNFQRGLTLDNDDFTQVPPIMGYSVMYDVLLEKQRNNC